VILELPEPEYSNLCYRIYLAGDQSFSKKAYYTIEKGMTGGFLCMWDGDRHVNLQRIASLEWSEKEVPLMRAVEARIVMDHFNSNHLSG